MKYIILLALVSWSWILFSQESLEKIELGGTQVYFKKHSVEGANVTYVNVHEDEQTSIQVLNKLSKRKRLNSMYLVHSGERRIMFAINSDTFNIDPNRIFTNVGIEKTLLDGGNYSDSAAAVVKVFGNQLAKKVAQSDFEYVVTLHNNTSDNYSILSYQQGGSEAGNTKELFVNSKKDPDDFIYTTDRWMYNELVLQKVNVILQNNENPVDDGSMSVYCGIHSVPYVNIETEHGHYRMQRRLLLKVRRLIRKKEL